MKIKIGGSDGLIRSLLWRKLKDVISHSLSLIFNKSLNDEIFVGIFKNGLVTSIFRSGDQRHANNYRPVCMLNILVLVFEKCVLNQLPAQMFYLISKK